MVWRAWGLGTAGLAPLAWREALSLSETAGDAGQHHQQIHPPRKETGALPTALAGGIKAVIFVKAENKCGYYLRVIPGL